MRTINYIVFYEPNKGDSGRTEKSKCRLVRLGVRGKKVKRRVKLLHRFRDVLYFFYSNTVAFDPNDIFYLLHRSAYRESRNLRHLRRAIENEAYSAAALT